MARDRVPAPGHWHDTVASSPTPFPNGEYFEISTLCEYRGFVADDDDVAGLAYTVTTVLNAAHRVASTWPDAWSWLKSTGYWVSLSAPPTRDR